MLLPSNPETKYLLAQTSCCLWLDSQTKARKEAEAVEEVVLVDVAVDAELLLAVALVVVALVVVLLAEASEVAVRLVVSVGAAARLAGVDRVASAEVADAAASKWAIEC